MSWSLSGLLVGAYIAGRIQQVISQAALWLTSSVLWSKRRLAQP